LASFSAVARAVHTAPGKASELVKVSKPIKVPEPIPAPSAPVGGDAEVGHLRRQPMDELGV
jgi:hypothetical protein